MKQLLLPQPILRENKVETLYQAHQENRLTNTKMVVEWRCGMGMVKNLMMEYCEFVHPNDFNAQDKLFLAICEGKVKISLAEMSRIIKEKPMSYPKAFRLVVKEPGHVPEIKVFRVEREDDVLALMQKLVGGYVEQIYVSREVAILADEDGIAKNLPQNCGMLGNLVFVALGTEDWESLTENQAQKAVRWLMLHYTDIHPGNSAWEITTGDEAVKRLDEVRQFKRRQDVEWDAI